MVACSLLVSNLSGTIIKWLDDEHFLISCQGKEILCHKDFWGLVSRQNT